MVPIAVFTLAHVPGVGVELSVTLLPTHTEEAVVVIADGKAFTVIALTLKHPLEPSE